MYQVACPSCGAQVQFRSAASVMAVCSYCQSTLLRDADSVRDIGKMSSVLEDYSPIQIGTSGLAPASKAAKATQATGGDPTQPKSITPEKSSSVRFTVVGRIQLQYEDGMWNEWYILYDDGSAGWLSDASGQYTLTGSAGKQDKAPLFERIEIGGQYNYNNQAFYASDIRTAQCIGGQGELPFAVGKGWQAKVIDFRSQDKFITLDYSDGNKPELFYGSATTLEKLQCQMLRDNDRIIESAGKLRGTAAALECPSCGASIQYRAGIAQHLVCPSCHAEVVAKPGQAEVLAKNDELEQHFTTSLNLGDKGRINGQDWDVIGLMECLETGDEEESSTWVEYLLYNPGKGFMWLVESMDGWDQIEVLNEWPLRTGNGSDYTIRGKTFRHLYTYGSTVTYAAGAFNWRVKIGDTTLINDYGKDTSKLTSEETKNEQNWSLSYRVTAAVVAQWFNKPQITEQKAGPPNLLDSLASFKKLAVVFTIIMLVINVPLLLASGFDGMGTLIGGLVFLWAPIWKFGKNSSDDDD